MNELKSIKITPTYVILKVGSWYHDAIAQVYPKPIIPITLTWESNKTSVATVNPVNGYVYANNPGIAIITARLNSEQTPTACYTVIVENENGIQNTTSLSKETITNSNAKTLAMRSDCGSYSDMAFGYSGTIYSYTISGNTATLHKGVVSKTKSYNYYAALFQSALQDMADIYNSFEPIQRQAWVVLRVYGILTAYSMDAIDAILLLAGVDLKGKLEATIWGMNAWYEAEEQAISCFSKF